MGIIFMIGLIIIIALVVSRPRVPTPIVIAIPEMREQRQWGFGSTLVIGFVILLILGLIALS